MNAGKIIAYIVAGVLILFGVLFILATFGQQGQFYMVHCWPDSRWYCVWGDLVCIPQGKSRDARKCHLQSGPLR